MDEKVIIKKLAENRMVFKNLLTGLGQEQIHWKPEPGKWNLVEVVCHLFDEEREDFRQRVQIVLENPAQPLPKFDPEVWVIQRAYHKQNFSEKLEKFLAERAQSIAWLEQLDQPAWENAFQHPKHGPMSARFFLVNWLAHDYLHIRQIIHLKYMYLSKFSGKELIYAGNW
ncbi:MAG: DinB family protein [Candidatus Cyclobacteriaceae bacterium M3_2C_046]